MTLADFMCSFPSLPTPSYMKSIGVLKTCEFATNAQNARALELMIPCHNNAATCYIKRKNYGDARLLSENVREEGEKKNIMKAGKKHTLAHARVRKTNTACI